MQFALSIVIVLLVYTTEGYLTPNLTGKYNVTITDGPLFDFSRHERNSTRPFAYMLSVFQPTVCSPTVPALYMPDKTAEFLGPYLQQLFNLSGDITPLFTEARLPVCANNSSNCSVLEDVPILLFSPGYGIPRGLYNFLLSNLASEGFTIFSIDSPDDAAIITYPDGRTLEGQVDPNPNEEVFAFNQGLRALAATYVIDQLSNATAMGQLLPRRGPRPFSTDRIAMLGHSEGGAASMTAASQDPRIRGAINWDGSIFLPLTSISQPIMWMSHDQQPSDDWMAAWPRLNGQKLWLRVANTLHQTYSDAPTLLLAAGQSAAPFNDVLGTIAAPEMVRIITDYSSAWMRGVFAGKIGGPLFEGNGSSKYPEVSTVMKAKI